MDLQDYLRVLRAHWIGIIVITAIAILGAGVHTLMQPKIYAATATGLVTTGGSDNNPALGAVNDQLAKSRVGSYLGIATSRPVADDVAKQLGLDAGSLGGNVTVTQPAGTVLLVVNARSTSPQRAQELASAWVKGLADQVQHIENPENKDATGVLGVEPYDAAVLPTSPVSPNPPRNLLIGGVLGLLLGLGYALVMSRLDRRMRSPEAAEKRFGIAILGRIPAAREGDSARLTIGAGKSSRTDGWTAGESLRKLRSNLSYMNVDDPPRVIVVTSPRPRDGKSTTAANLAGAMAASGQRVTLVDGDLRRPTVADTLGLAEGAGLTDVLIGTVQLDDVLQTHPDLPMLSVLAAGNLPPNPSELLGSLAMQSVLKELEERGMVIIDAPPLLPVTDGAILTREADGAIIVVAYGATLDTELDESLRQLASVQGNVLGLVFNKMPVRDAAYGYTYYGTGKKPSLKAVTLPAGEVPPADKPRGRGRRATS